MIFAGFPGTRVYGHLIRQTRTFGGQMSIQLAFDINQSSLVPGSHFMYTFFLTILPNQIHCKKQ